ncbi:hypothetical protein Misp03_36010 [Microbispora sp. NBRC 16548]|nr:hypothetical protein Misp03_36010 [Microbispora sp. NBRC 16548]
METVADHLKQIPLPVWAGGILALVLIVIAISALRTRRARSLPPASLTGIWDDLLPKQHAIASLAEVHAQAKGPRLRAWAARVTPFVLLSYFVATVAGLSAQGLTGFGRDNMRLTGPWPYLLFFALDGAAGLCAFLVTRRAARNDVATGPRIAVWLIIGASSAFNAAHAPDRPGAAASYALLPIIGAMLFEFTLAEVRRSSRARVDRRLGWTRWLHPVERIRVEMMLATDETMTAAHATRRVRVLTAAACLHRLRQAHESLAAHPERRRAGKRVARCERKAQAALTRAEFADPDVAVRVIREMQVLTSAQHLAMLDYSTPDEAQSLLSNLMIAPSASLNPMAAPVDQANGQASASLNSSKSTLQGTEEQALPQSEKSVNGVHHKSPGKPPLRGNDTSRVPVNDTGVSSQTRVGVDSERKVSDSPPLRQLSPARRARILRIRQLLTTRPEASTEEVAGAIGVRLRTVQRDISDGVAHGLLRDLQNQTRDGDSC